MLTIEFQVDKNEKEILGQAIHESLQGSHAYISNDIILNINETDKVVLTLGDSNGQSKTINIDEDSYRIVDDNEAFDVENELDDRMDEIGEIIRLRVKGYSARMISQHLGISEPVVRAIIFGKLEESNESGKRI